MKKVISIIDDDEELVDILRDFLIHAGYKVRTYSHTTFIDVLEQDNFDLLLLDIWFDANRAGIEMAQAIRNRKKLKSKPIIMMSSDTNLGKHASVACIANFLPKPIDFEALLEIIKNLFGSRSNLQLSPEFATYNQNRGQT